MSSFLTLIQPQNPWIWTWQCADIHPLLARTLHFQESTYEADARKIEFWSQQWVRLHQTLSLEQQKKFKAVWLEQIQRIKTQKNGEVTSSSFIKFLEQEIQSLQNQLAIQEKIASAAQHLQWMDYDQKFPCSQNGTRRHFTFILGPTNSGKTYRALEALKKLQPHQRGCYLGPLRLLALEIYETLQKHEAGFCSLVTGDDRRHHDQSRVDAQTIEMLNPNQRYDVAVIDEIQMLEDPDRGWAWTDALLGVQAKEVFVLGSLKAKKTLEALAEKFHWDCTWIETQRETPLARTEKFHGDFKPYDAWVCFSRREVLEKAQELQQKGIACSVLYGALSPEVRQKQAERFADGTHPVLVCTDVIGMGLNLPIQRIIFSTTFKFNGRNECTLNDEEIRQIAGRAGRRGLTQNPGQALVVHHKDAHKIEHAIRNSPHDHEAQRLFIKPKFKDIHALLPYYRDIYQIPSDTSVPLHKLLTFFQQHLNFQHPVWKSASLDEWIDKATEFQALEKTMDPEVFFTYMAAPFNPQTQLSACVSQWMNLHRKNQPIHWRSQCPQNNLSTQGLKMAEEDMREGLLYMWLAYHFPECYTEEDHVHHQLISLTSTIDKTLVQHYSHRQQNKSTKKNKHKKHS